MSEKKVRVRFAPSPTGALHIGGARTALFNYLFAKRNGGTFILRIEDTDQTRFVADAEDYIVKSLEWFGIVPDEGPGFGGQVGPYRQSERKTIYKEYVDKLLADGWAYYSFDSPEELDELRAEAEQKKEVFSYGIPVRGNLNNSLNRSKEEVDAMLNSGSPYVVRFKMPENTDVTEVDIIRGSVTFNTNQLDDKVIFKSDGMPTYHLANVVDDHLMKISHVIRGEEWLPSMPLHVLLYKALGWEDTKPQFAHMPLTLKPQGKGKLSKRDGEKLGFPVFPLPWKDPATGSYYRSYKEDGYFPEAFINLIAMLGWNPGTEQEIFSMDELIEIYSLERMVKSGSRFDPEKAKWFNKHYFQEKSATELTQLFIPVLKEKNIEANVENVEKIVELVKERCGFVSEIWDQSFYFFVDPTEYDEKTVKKAWKENTSLMLSEIISVFETVTDWQAGSIKESFSAFMNEKGWGFGAVMNPLRLSLVGGNMGPDLFLICELLGKDKTIQRIKTALKTLEK